MPALNPTLTASHSKRTGRLAPAVLVFLTLAASAASPKRALTLYHAQLAAKCPAKHLEMLSPAALSDLTEDFTPRLSATQRRKVQASMDLHCRGIDMGATCGNVGFLQAVITLHRLDPFTTLVCAQKQRCTDFSICTDTE